MKLHIDIQTGQLNAIIAKLRRKDVTIPLRQAAVYIEGSTRQNFVLEKDPNGTPWQPLAASTLARKSSGKILTETGRLVNSISHSVSGNTARVYTNVEYAPYLQFGTKYMPARPFMGIGRQDQQNIEQIFGNYFKP